MESIRLDKGQQRRAEVLGRLSAGSVTKEEAGMLLKVGRRQVDRLLVDYRERGIASVVHGNSGRKPLNKTSSEAVERVLSVAGEGGKYYGFNVCHVCDLLAEKEGISIGRSTLDRVLREGGVIKSSKGKRQTRRKRRERASSEGTMLQIDGSPHDWLEGRGPKMSLMGAVDDATGKIAHALYRPTEDLAGYLMMMRMISKTHGLPESIYHDRHTILRSPKPATIEDDLAGVEPMSQFQRVVTELGITAIPAGSPQAKGRVERLWGVLQDRLVKEMRLENISTIEEANAFLPEFVRRYNRRFARKAADPNTAWVKMEPKTDLAYYFCTKDRRKVRDDHTISWLGRTLQILPGSRDRCLAGAWVNVHVTPEDEVFLYDGKHRLQYQVVPSAVRLPVQTNRTAKRTQPDPESEAKRRGWLFAQTAA